MLMLAAILGAFFCIKTFSENAGLLCYFVFISFALLRVGFCARFLEKIANKLILIGVGEFRPKRSRCGLGDLRRLHVVERKEAFDDLLRRLNDALLLTLFVRFFDDRRLVVRACRRIRSEIIG